MPTPERVTACLQMTEEDRDAIAAFIAESENEEELAHFRAQRDSHHEWWEHGGEG